VETVIHHRREFVLYSLRDIEPMKKMVGKTENVQDVGGLFRQY